MTEFITGPHAALLARTSNGLLPTTTGEESYSRLLAVSSNSLTSGSLRLGFFTARKTELVTSLRFACATTAAGATPTIIRYGLYTEAANGDATLVASTPNDTALLAVTSTGYTKALSTPYLKVAGVRYAVGIVVVTAAAVPNVSAATVPASESRIFPQLGSSLTGQTDLPSSAPFASTVNSGAPPYCVMLP